MALSDTADAQRDATKFTEEVSDQELMTKQLSTPVCICKGIPLSKFLPCLESANTVEKIHQHVGSGQGGCRGRRCTPRVKKLIDKYRREVLGEG